MKTYVLTVSRTFPTTHPRKGEETYFITKIKRRLCFMFFDMCCCVDCNISGTETKIHTIRANYELWYKRIKEVQEGKAILSLRYWSGKPYNSKQIELARLDKNSGISVQKLEFFESDFNCPYTYGLDGVSNEPLFEISKLALNDGLSLEDFKQWFRKYDLSKPMAIIHFTPFRY